MKNKQIQFIFTGIFAFMHMILYQANAADLPLDFLLIDETYFADECNYFPEQGMSSEEQKKSLISDSERRMRNFKTAVCQFHQKSADIAEIEKTIALIRTLQTQGLSPAQQSFATLMEGLLHCRSAGHALNELREHPDSEHAKIRLCKSRRMAVASFSDIDWQYAQFDYDEKLPYKFDALMDEMESGYSTEQDGKLLYGPLHPEFNLQCGIVSGPSKAEREKLVANQSESVSTDYFGAITAMFQRKKDMADTIKTKAEKDIKVLVKDAKDVANVHGALQNHYDKMIKPNIDEIMKKYIGASSIAKSIMEQYNTWESNLLVDPNDNNKDLSDPCSETTDKLKKITETVNRETQELIKLSEYIRKLQNKRKDEQKLTKDICKSFFCGLLNTETGGVSTTPYEEACLGLSKNPLCIHEDMKQIVLDGNENLSTICREAGFDFDKYGKLQLTENEINQCWEQ
ncbi:MAG: hypothetical protein GY795_39235 [Desulfobacterales bacterium]|nr:hypothetical protein [Desulfobacterales bacterium]